jgi:hypothetical protein
MTAIVDIKMSTTKGLGAKLMQKKSQIIFITETLIFTKEKLIKPAGTRSVLSNLFVAEA